MSLRVDRRRWLRFGRDHPPFQGMIVGDDFHLARIIHYGNSFLPQVLGTVQARPDGGSRLTGRMRLAYPTAIFMSFWLAGVGLIGLPLTCTLLARDPFAWADLIPVFMLVAATAMVLGGFHPEARKALSELRDIAESTGPGWI
jgi:hypothetical protein